MQQKEELKKKKKKDKLVSSWESRIRHYYSRVYLQDLINKLFIIFLIIRWFLSKKGKVP